MVFLLSCSSGKIQEKDPLYGTRGLTINFIRGIPPSQVYEGDQIDIGIELSNEGSYPITRGFYNLITENQYVSINNMGYEKDFIGEYPMQGKTLFSQKGDKKQLSILANIGDVESFSGIDTNLVVQACYEYMTNLSTEVCIDTNQYDNSYEKPCKVKTLTFSGEGAPISITKVEPRISTRINPLGEKIIIPQFILYIKKVQQGEVINPNKLEEICGNGYVNDKDFGRLIVKGKLGNVPLKCEPGTEEKPLLLSQNYGEEFQGNTVRCLLDNEIQKKEGTYTSILNIQLYYGFSIKTSKKLTILNT